MSPSLNRTASRKPVTRALTSTRLIASTRPTKSRVLVIGLRSATTVPTGTVVGCGCCARAATPRPHMRIVAQTARRMWALPLWRCADQRQFGILCCASPIANRSAVDRFSTEVRLVASRAHIVVLQYDQHIDLDQ